MSTRKAILIVVLILFVLMFFSIFMGQRMAKAVGGSDSKVLIGKNNWLVVDPSGVIEDYNEVMPIKYLKSISPNSVESMCKKIRYAATDKRIKGILLEPKAGFSLPALNEIGLALKEFKASGKPIYAVADAMDQADYLMASFADEIALDPSASGGIALTGTGGGSFFFKNILDKYGIKMHVIQAGEFKGAGEPYAQTSFSEGTRQNIAKAFSDRFELILSTLAENRGLTIDDMRAVYSARKNFFILADEALEMKLIDVASTRADYLEKNQIEKKNSISIAKYSVPPKESKSNKIAVVYLSGEIRSGESSYRKSSISYDKVRKITQDLSQDKDIKAVVLRVDSPGGSALESDHIYHELLKLKQDKPIVISMSGVAASGGYYISCAADKILADAGTITGSIGVIMTLPEFSQAERKLGINYDGITFGKYAGINQHEPIPADFLASLKHSAIGTYDEFKGIVMKARGISPEKINSIAEGRIYSAQDALTLGLIDEIGSLDMAVAHAAEMAGITDYSTVNYPGQMSFLDALTESDLFNMLSPKLFGGKWQMEMEKYERALDMLEPGTWQYLMPIMVD